MLPFLQIPITLPGNEGEEEKEVIARIQPEKIEAYYPGYHWGTFIYLQGGVVLLSKCKTEEIEFNINAYWNTVLKKANEQSSITLLT